MVNRTTEPDLQDIMEGGLTDLLYSFNCMRIGIIESFNSSSQTAKVRLVDKAVVNTTQGEQLKEYSLLVDCPVMVNKGINGGITVPIVKGDTCLVFFNDRDIDNWFIDGLVQRPNTLRAHGLADGIVYVGIRNQVNKIIDYVNNATEINYLTSKISLDSTKISLQTGSGGSIVIDNKLKLENSAENLKDLIDELISIVTSLKTVDPISGELPIDAATASSLSTLSNRVGALLK